MTATRQMRRPAAAVRILLVDDDPATLEVLELALSLDGHQVTCAGDGVEGLNRIRHDKPDLVIVDWMMPIMDGVTMVAQVRAQHRLSHLPMLMLTARTMPSNAWKALRSGADAYLTKPLDLDVLRDEIDRLCLQSTQASAPATEDLRPGPVVSAAARAAWVTAANHALTRRRQPLLEVAVAGKLSLSTLGQVLAGTHWPRLDTILAISELLDIDLPHVGDID